MMHALSRLGAVSLLVAAVAASGCISPRQSALFGGDAGDVADDVSAGGRSPNPPAPDASLAADAPLSPPADAGPALPPSDASASACAGSQHRCSGVCVADTDPDHCGAACQRCDVPLNGSAICRNGGCDVTCESGYHACNKVCWPDGDAQHCGSSCIDCPDPPGGVAACRNGACNSFCMNGYHACNGGCSRNDDVQHCGLACISCPAVPNGTPVCRLGNCDVDCAGGTVSCGTSPPACFVPAWTFESGSTEGWSLKTGSGQHNAGGPLRVSAARSHSGGHALATDVTVNSGQQAYVVTLEVSICASGGVDLGGKTISMWAFFDGPPVDQRVISDPYVYTLSGTSYDPLSFAGQSPRTPASNQWYEIRAVLPDSEDHVVYKMDFFTNLNIDGWAGTIYLDDVTIK